MGNTKRETTQYLMPSQMKENTKMGYEVYPTFKLEENRIFDNLKLFVKRISKRNSIIIDGYIGVDFEGFRRKLDDEFNVLGKTVSWVNIELALKSEERINQMIEPFMGDNDSLFGIRTSLDLEDYFDSETLKNLNQNSESDVNIIYGPGAQLSNWSGLLIYIDLPKNELQFRARAKSITNLGASKADDMGRMYKRYYFVDWIVLNKHKKNILSKIDFIIDGQQENDFVWMEGEELRKGLKKMSDNFFRVRPWFEPGVWGGTWIKDKISGLNRKVLNYAWSFELITPENGIVFESSDTMF